MGQGACVAIPFEGKSRDFLHACHEVGHDADLMTKLVKDEWTRESGEQLSPEVLWAQSEALG